MEVQDNKTQLLTITTRSISSPSAPGWVNNSNEHGAFQLWVLL